MSIDVNTVVCQDLQDQCFHVISESCCAHKQPWLRQVLQCRQRMAGLSDALLLTS